MPALLVLASLLLGLSTPTISEIPRSACGQDSPAPLLNYQDLQDLKLRMAERLVEVEVALAVPAGADPSIAPVLVGQAVCVDEPPPTSPSLEGNTGTAMVAPATEPVPPDPATEPVPPDPATEPVPLAPAAEDGQPASKAAPTAPRCTIVASRFLLENASSIRVRCAAHPEWAPATARLDSNLIPLAVVETSEPLGCGSVSLAPLRFQAPGTFVFSADDPVSQYPNVFYGETGEWAEAPLAGYLLMPIGLPLSGPLFSAECKLVAINLRPYVPGSPLNLSATAAQVRRFLQPARRAPAGHIPSGRRTPFPRNSESLEDEFDPLAAPLP